MTTNYLILANLSSVYNAFGGLLALILAVAFLLCVGLLITGGLKVAKEGSGAGTNYFIGAGIVAFCVIIAAALFFMGGLGAVGTKVQPKF